MIKTQLLMRALILKLNKSYVVAMILALWEVKGRWLCKFEVSLATIEDPTCEIKSTPYIFYHVADQSLL